MKCVDCGQDILQTHPEICPYCKSKNLIDEEDLSKKADEAEALAKAGRFEEAALLFEKLDLWDKAKDCRAHGAKKNRPSNLPEAEVEAVTLVCPHCGQSQPVTHPDEMACNRCGTLYAVPQAVRELLGVSKTKLD